MNLKENTGVLANPTAQDVDREAAMVRQGKYDLLIAVGGGSVIDFVKGLAITAPNQKVGDPAMPDFMPPRLSLGLTRTFSVQGRRNLVTIDELSEPDADKQPDWSHPELDELAGRIAKARKDGHPVIWFMGAHVVKCGLSRYVIALMQRGLVTHVASNGAGSIHDFELAYLGGTSEHVPTAIEDGTFGMWEETGGWMNKAIRDGYQKGYGYGQSLAEYIQAHRESFPHAEDCIVHQAYRLGIPATYHITIGADIIHQHPLADFSALGGASGIDFAVFCASVAKLTDGVFLNFGSAVTGPEIFLKALSIARNQGYGVSRLTTANFDLIPLGDYRADIGSDHYQYYYRPLKNIVNRPTSLGGKGFYIEGDHRATIPALYRKLTAILPGAEV